LLLARIEDISHILVWVDSSKQIKSVELPRLRLSFQQLAGKLMCKQHNGFWLVADQYPSDVQRLLVQYGGGTLLLENSSREFMVLVSAIAEPIRPAATEKPPAEPLENFLPSQLVFRRGRKKWMDNLSEGSCHYYYPVHLSGTFVFSPTTSASLYLLLCRFSTWHFSQVATMASSLSEIVTTEEKQLWERLALLQYDCHADAVACRLRITYAMRPYGDTAAPKWDTRSQLTQYTIKRHLVSADCALSVAEEFDLSMITVSKSASLELQSRYSMLKNLANLQSSEAQFNMNAGPLLDDYGYDRIDDKKFLASGSPGTIKLMMAGAKYIPYKQLDLAKMKAGERLENTKVQ